MLIFEIIALFSCGTFFGAAIYISVAQHPTMLEAGVAVGGRFFPPMYQRAAIMQIACAVLGFVAGMFAWYQQSEVLWLLGALLLISVVPITLILIKPVNAILLAPDSDPDAPETEALLQRWGPKHWLRTIVSGLSFLTYLYVTLKV